MLNSGFPKQTLLLSFLLFSWAGGSAAQEIYDARKIKPKSFTKIPMEEMIKSIPKGSIVVIGELHNKPSMQQGELGILKALRSEGHKVNVGMELLEYTAQSNLEAYRSGNMTEEDFLKSSWRESDFNFYQEQILFPEAKNGEETFAINSPRELPLAVKAKGLAKLTRKEKALLPPNFKLGGSNYRKRFEEKMRGHVKGKREMNRYFQTQSVWDDTMAWKVCEAKRKSEGTLVLVVGMFHVEYGDSLIRRIRARCSPSQSVVSIYQYLFYNDETYNIGEFAPSRKYGPLSDYLMIVKED